MGFRNLQEKLENNVNIELGKTQNLVDCRNGERLKKLKYQALDFFVFKGRFSPAVKTKRLLISKA